MPVKLNTQIIDMSLKKKIKILKIGHRSVKTTTHKIEMVVKNLFLTWPK